MNKKDNAVKTAYKWMKADPLFLDTETTGLDKNAEICEIAILNVAGKALLDTLIRPCGLISKEASNVHGINSKMVANAPAFVEIIPEVKKILKSRTVLIYNLDFDWRLLKQSARAHKIKDLGITNSSWYCVMKVYAEFYGKWNDYYGNYKWQRLNAAALHCGIELPEDLHRARADAELTRQLVTYMASWK